MRRLILSWLLVVVSAVGCATYANRTTPEPPTTFEQACEGVERHYDWVRCSDANLQPPIVVVSRIVDPRYYGFYYRGENFVFIRPDMAPDLTRDVILHETVHYIIDHLMILISHCDNEEMARTITSEYNGKPIDPTWEKRYGCELWSTGDVQW